MDAVGLQHFLNVAQKLILAGPQLVRRHHQGNAVNARGQVLQHQLILFQHLQNPPQHAHLIAHAVFGDGDNGEILPSGDTRNEVSVQALLRLVEGLHDHGARMLRLIGVADVQGNILLPHREDGPLVKHLGSDVAQLPQLRVGNALNGQRVLHNPGVRHEEARHIRPVFIHIRVQGRRRQGAGDVAAAPGKGLDAPVGHSAVKARDHHPPAGGRPGQDLVALLLVHRAVQVKLQPQLAVQEVVAQVVRHEPCREIFAPAHQLVLADACVHLLAQGGKLRFQVRFQPQVVPNLHVSRADHVEYRIAGHPVFKMCIAQIQQVRQLVVVGKPLSCGGNDDHPPGRVRLHNTLHLFKLLGVRHGGAAEFQHL